MPTPPQPEECCRRRCLPGRRAGRVLGLPPRTCPDTAVSSTCRAGRRATRLWPWSAFAPPSCLLAAPAVPRSVWPCPTGRDRTPPTGLGWQVIGAGRGPAWAAGRKRRRSATRSEEHTSELQSRQYLVCRLLLEKKNKIRILHTKIQ